MRIRRGKTYWRAEQSGGGWTKPHCILEDQVPSDQVLIGVYDGSAGGSILLSQDEAIDMAYWMLSHRKS